MATSKDRAQADAARVLGADDASRGPIEAWSWIAFALFVLAGVGIAYLGARPGGKAPIWIWAQGRFFLVGVALLWALVGLVWCALRRPFVQRRRGRAFVALVVLIGVLPLPMPYPSSKESAPSAVSFVLPVEGEWLVHHSGTGGGPLGQLTADRRFGVLLAKEADLEREDWSEAEEHSGHGAPVYAPADGTVVLVRDGLADRTREALRDGGGPELGNVIVMEVAEEEYLVLGHLLAGSFVVAEGDTVVAGQPLAQVGFSGWFRFTAVPHLSLHLQSTPEEGWGEPVPWSFRGYAAEGVPVERGVPRQGTTVRAR
ncbi:MAG: peptidoglycan DD-metalloendopeptidase family protein [Planctomycetota bacterium]|nr:peptidoglycan DD-metalloendopeptidase family protein [Planctomycetota bacterium]